MENKPQEKYIFKLRPGYKSQFLLIEFENIRKPDEFLTELAELLTENGFKFDGVQDVWMNDEIWVNFNSKNGSVTVTKDIWGLIFILADKNQPDIMEIAQILIADSRFLKQNVDFSEYS